MSTYDDDYEEDQTWLGDDDTPQLLQSDEYLGDPDPLERGSAAWWDAVVSLPAVNTRPPKSVPTAPSTTVPRNPLWTDYGQQNVELAYYDVYDVEAEDEVVDPAQAQLAEVLRELAAALPERQRVALYGLGVAGGSQRKTALATGSAAKTAKRDLARATATLRKALLANPDIADALSAHLTPGALAELNGDLA